MNRSAARRRATVDSRSERPLLPETPLAVTILTDSLLINATYTKGGSVSVQVIRMITMLLLLLPGSGYLAAAPSDH